MRVAGSFEPGVVIVWLISMRDLQYRYRRFLIAVAVTALVFGIAVAIDGIKQTLQTEPDRLVAAFGADTWVVQRGSTGLFTTTALLPESVVGELRETPGVRSAQGVLSAFTTITGEERKNVNVIGFDLHSGGPEIVEGRAPQGEHEAVLGGGLDAEVGQQVATTSGAFTVVGRVAGLRFNGGTPTIFLTLSGAQTALMDGLPMVMGVAVEGQPEGLPAGTGITTNQAVSDDLRLTLSSATSTIDFVAFLTWIIAGGVIGAIVYLTAIDRTRDFAVLRATGSPKRLVVGGLMIQSLLLSMIAAGLAVPLAMLLRSGMPMPVTLSGSSVIRIVIVGIVVGVVASLAAVRRAVTTDPAVAFGGV